jgi:dATP pyrophosphohydrolase
MNASAPYKIPHSVLVVIHDCAGDVLLIERASQAGFWQSVTGSLDQLSESHRAAAVREVMEEVGIDASMPGCKLTDWGLENIYEIYPMWRHRYAPGVTHNTERVFGLCVPKHTAVTLSAEHTAYQWLSRLDAAQACFSPSNAEAILLLDRYGRV